MTCLASASPVEKVRSHSTASSKMLPSDCLHSQRFQSGCPRAVTFCTRNEAFQASASGPKKDVNARRGRASAASAWAAAAADAASARKANVRAEGAMFQASALPLLLAPARPDAGSCSEEELATRKEAEVEAALAAPCTTLLLLLLLLPPGTMLELSSCSALRLSLEGEGEPELEFGRDGKLSRDRLSGDFALLQMRACW